VLPVVEFLFENSSLMNIVFQMLFDYLTSQGRMIGDYKLLTTYPKRDVRSFDTIVALIRLLFVSSVLVNQLESFRYIRTVKIISTRAINS
jgi:hypothetical protein